MIQAAPEQVKLMQATLEQDLKTLARKKPTMFATLMNIKTFD